MANGIGILIWDEDRVFARHAARVLKRAGYDVFTCGSLEEARGMAEGGGIRLLVADLGVPGKEAVEVLREFHGFHPGMDKILLVAHGTIEGAVSAMRMGALDYVAKPVTDEELVEIVGRAVARGTLVGEVEKSADKAGGGWPGGSDERVVRVVEMAQRVAGSRSTVLVMGESGTGKTMLARAIHAHSPRATKPFVELSCGSLSETLLESELFGHVKGAFTGAVSEKIGRLAAAEGGTLFLDEINSASPAMQVKLLRVLQERVYEAVGSSVTQRADVRFVVASNVELGKLVSEGKFREDLYYRVNVVSLRLPALRERSGDIRNLAEGMLKRISGEMGRQVVGFSEEAMGVLCGYGWPGNIRELENAVEHAVVMAGRPMVEAGDLPEGVRSARVEEKREGFLIGGGVTLEAALEGPEREIIVTALKRNGWSRSRTAEELGINRTTLYKKMRKYGLDGADRWAA